MIHRLEYAPERRSAPAPRPSPLPGLVLFAVSFALRALYVWVSQGPHATASSDAALYDTAAWNLARGFGLALDGVHGPYPTAVVPPVTSWLASLLYRVVGHDYFAALLGQCAIGALVPLAASALGGALFGGGAGRLAGWLTAFHPLLVFFCGYLLTETTFTALLTLALLASVSWVKTPRPARALGTGLVWGAAILTRPTGALLPLLIAAWAWVPLGLTLAARDRVRQTLLLAFGVVLVVLPWSVRNSLVTGHVVALKTGAGRAFLDSNNPVVWSDPATRGGANNAYAIEPYASRLAGHGEVEVDSIASALAWQFLNAHRAEWPAMALAKVARFWRLTSEGGATGDWQGARSPLRRLLRLVDPLLVWSLLTLPFALWGVARSLGGSRRWFQSILIGVIAFFTLLTIPYWGALRLRVPIEPLVMIYAAAGFEDARRFVRQRSRGFRVIEGVR